jgi:putative transposase
MYKAAVSRICRKRECSAFKWQPRFYEHVIRSERDLDRIRRYIQENPSRWNCDALNPANIPRRIGR